MHGYKVVNYNRMESIPDIFKSVGDATEYLNKWEYKEGAIIEYFNSKYNKAKTIAKFVDGVIMFEKGKN